MKSKNKQTKPPPDLPLEPRVIRHFQSTESRSFSEGNMHMFFEEMEYRVIPMDYEIHKSKIKPEISINGNLQCVESAKKILSTLCRYGRENDTNELVSEAIRTLARSLGEDGEFACEIIRYSQSGKVDHLYQFTPRHLKRLGRYFIQRIPRADRKHWKKSIVWVPANDIFIVRMPSLLGGTKRHKAMLRQLCKFHEFGPDLLLKDMRAGKQQTNFNFKEFQSMKLVRNWRLTRLWGWDFRESLDTPTEIYWFYKAITFKWASTVLRDHIIYSLNQLFNRLKINASISTSGLPSPEQVLRVRNELIAGTLSFGAAYDSSCISDSAD